MTQYERIAAQIATQLNADTVEVLVIVVAKNPQAKKLPTQTIEATCEEAPPTTRRAA